MEIITSFGEIEKYRVDFTLTAFFQMQTEYWYLVCKSACCVWWLAFRYIGDLVV